MCVFRGLLNRLTLISRAALRISQCVAFTEPNDLTCYFITTRRIIQHREKFKERIQSINWPAIGRDARASGELLSRVKRRVFVSATRKHFGDGIASIYPFPSPFLFLRSNVSGCAPSARCDSFEHSTMDARTCVCSRAPHPSAFSHTSLPSHALLLYKLKG